MSGSSGIGSNSKGKRAQNSGPSSPSAIKKAKPEAPSPQSKNVITRQRSEEGMDDDEYEVPEFNDFDNDDIMDDEAGEDMGFLTEATVKRSRVVRGRLSEKETRVLTVDDVVNSQKKLIERANDIFQLPPALMRILLRYFKWDVDRLLEGFAASPDKIFEEAGLAPPDSKVKIPTTGKATCLTCMEDLPVSQMSALGCGHLFCDGCWRDYLTLKINEEGMRLVGVTCMAHKCKLLVDEDIVKKVVNKDLYQKYMRFLLQSYVDEHQRLSWCMGAGCPFAIEISPGDRDVAVTCKCGAEFCFACHEAPHQPASCPMAVLWKKKLVDDSETFNWLGANTKDCPKCHKAVEKNGGCNHITCPCGAHFCWMCNKEYDTRTVYNHGCNAFSNEKTQNDAQTIARLAIDRYLHYFTRYDNHAKSKKLEAKLLDVMKGKMTDLMNRDTTNSSWIDNLYLEDSTHALFQCRDILKNTYIYGFYMFEPSNLQSETHLKTIPHFPTESEAAHAKSQFEFYQEDLESTTEQLSNMLEMKTDAILNTKNFRVKVIDLTKAAMNKFDAMFAVIKTLNKKTVLGGTVKASEPPVDPKKAKKEADKKEKKDKKKATGPVARRAPAALPPAPAPAVGRMQPVITPPAKPVARPTQPAARLPPLPPGSPIPGSPATKKPDAEVLAALGEEFEGDLELQQALLESMKGGK